MSFWPTGPVGVTTSVIIAALCVILAARGNAGRAIAIAFAVSWITAGLSTYLDSQAVKVAGLTAAAVAAYLGGSKACLAISFLYGVRIIASAFIPLIGWAMFWEVNIVFLWLQILIAAGELIPVDGYRHKVSYFRKFYKKANNFTLFSRCDHAD